MTWWYEIFYSVIVYFCVSLVIPTLIMLFVTGNLIRSLKKARDTKKQMNTGTGQSGRRKAGSEDLTLTLILVVAIFVLCNMFNPLRRVIYGVYGIPSALCGHFLYPVTSLTPTVHIFNASVNFVIYVLCGKTFRNRVKALLMRKKNRVGHFGFTHSTNTGKSNAQSLRF